MLYLPTPSAYFDRTFADTICDEVREQPRSASGLIPGPVLLLTDIQIGETRYTLRKPVHGEFLPCDDGTCELWVDGFSPEFVGRGRRAQDAFQDWRDRVHEAFQELYGKRPFEMTPEESDRWELLQDTLDVVGYRNATPVLVREVGAVDKVFQAPPRPRRIRWIDDRTDMVSLDIMPGEFASYKVGQPFEADVERDPLTWKLVKVRSIRRIKTIHPMAKGELQEFWRSLPGTNTLPASMRDWAET